jgi:predicted ABC-type ATPase
MTPKELIVVGGPNGAGKTTFALDYAKIRNIQFLSADAIAAEISPDNISDARIAAGKEFVRRFRTALNGDASLIVESTLSGRSLIQLLQTAKAELFSLEIIFVFLESADTCL